MYQRIKNALIAIVIGLFGIASFSPAVMADTVGTSKDQVCQGILASGEKCTSSTSSINKTIGFVINLLSSIVGITAVIMIVYSGFKYVSSGGDSSKVSTARNTLIYAVVGLVVVALAQVIVRFVVKQVS